MAVRLAILVSHAAAVSQLLCQSVRQSGAQSVGQTDSQLVRQMNRGVSFWKNCGAASVGKSNKVI